MKTGAKRAKRQAKLVSKGCQTISELSGKPTLDLQKRLRNPTTSPQETAP